MANSGALWVGALREWMGDLCVEEKGKILMGAVEKGTPHTLSVKSDHRVYGTGQRKQKLHTWTGVEGHSE